MTYPEAPRDLAQRRPPVTDQVDGEAAVAGVELHRACPGCGRRVLPDVDGVCPGCGRPWSEVA